MDLLSLPVIGWLYVVASVVALCLGIWLTVGLHASGESARRQLAARAMEDSVLFGIWILGLAGGIGVLLEKSWSRWVLELFCWVLVALVLMSSYARIRAAPPPRSQVLLGHCLLVIPVTAFCAATILTLRSETALKAFAG